MPDINLDKVTGPTITLERGKSYSLSSPLRDRSLITIGDRKLPRPLITYRGRGANSPIVQWTPKSAGLRLDGFAANLSGGAIVCEFAGINHMLRDILTVNGGLVHFSPGSGSPAGQISECQGTGTLEHGGVYWIYGGADNCEPKVSIQKCTASVRNDSEAICRLQRGQWYLEDYKFESLGSKWGKQAAHFRGHRIISSHGTIIGSLICGQLWKQERSKDHPIPDWIKRDPAYIDQINRGVGGNVDARRVCDITLKATTVAGYVDIEPGATLAIDGGEYTNTGQGGGILLRPSGAYLDRPAAKVSIAGNPKLTAPTITNAPDRVMGLANVTKAATAKNVKR